MLTSSELSTPKEKETSGNVLDVKITNFGPISKGRISLRPLTILMGPNNSGKSYAAILVHSVMNAISYVPDTDSNIPVDRIVKECENAYKNGKRSHPCHRTWLPRSMTRSVKRPSDALNAVWSVILNWILTISYN